MRIWKGLREQDSVRLGATRTDYSAGIEQALRFARILMYVGLFWFFWQAWAEKAGYLSNPHSSDEIDLPFEFGGTMLGFWMARVLTKPFDGHAEKFTSTFAIDFVSSGVIGLLYTVIVGPLIEGVARSVGHSLYTCCSFLVGCARVFAIPKNMRPLELLLIAIATWWALNHFYHSDEATRLGDSYDERPAETRWNAPKSLVVALVVTIGYLAILAIMFSLLEPQGWSWTIATAGAGLVFGTVAFLLVKWAGRDGLTRLLQKTGDGSGDG